MIEEKNYAEAASEKAKQIVEAIKKKTARTAYKLSIIPDSQPGILDSKFGGVPYWDNSKDYPLDSEGRKMMLLAQINFTKAALNDERLPKQGMLQFFISSEDDALGADFNEPDVQKGFRVIYHETINTDVTKEQILQMNLPIASEVDICYSPVYIEAALDIHKETTYMGVNSYEFAKIFQEAVREAANEEVEEEDVYDCLEEDDNDYLYEELGNTGHWLLGHPFFIQTDPREFMDQETAKYYDTLLFKMDSDGNGKEDYVDWGDCGVANFLINGEALKRLDFSKVLYYFD